jgi:hypothetical protein
MAPFILIADNRWGKASASGTSRFSLGENWARCPVNRRLSGQKGRYGSSGEKKILSLPGTEPRDLVFQPIAW